MNRVPWPLRISSRLALRAWFTPPSLRSEPAPLSGDAQLEKIATPEGGVDAYTFGGGPMVLILHGWGGDPRRLLPLAEAVANAGHRSVVPLLPGRAGSGQTDVVQVAEVVRQVVDHFGEPYAVIAHSFGAMVPRLVFDVHQPERMVYIAPMVKVSDGLDAFGDALGLMPWVRSSMLRRLEAWNPSLWPTVDTVGEDQVPGAELLIIHDPADPDTSFERAATLAALRPDTRIVAVSGLGHHRVVADGAVIDTIVDFLGTDDRLRLASATAR